MLVWADLTLGPMSNPVLCCMLYALHYIARCFLLLFVTTFRQIAKFTGDTLKTAPSSCLRHVQMKELARLPPVKQGFLQDFDTLNYDPLVLCNVL